jgi:fucose 4-O-acetylase-like acetyltransferase
MKKAHQKPERKIWIDFAKAIGIWLVILGHMPLLPNLKNIIYSFHMPLFFFISGFLEKNNGIKYAIYNGFQKLIVPYISYNCIFYIYWLVIVFLRHYDIYSNESLVYLLCKPIIGMFLLVDAPYSIRVNGPYMVFSDFVFYQNITQFYIKI